MRKVHKSPYNHLIFFLLSNIPTEPVLVKDFSPNNIIFQEHQGFLRCTGIKRKEIPVLERKAHDYVEILSTK